MNIVIVASTSGQHASVVREAAMLSGQSVAGIVAIDDDPLPDIAERAGPGRLAALSDSDYRNHTFVVACGSNAVRREIAGRLALRGAVLESVIHPSAVVSPSARIGDGSMILAGAVIGPSAVLGSSCIVNHCASVDHHCRLGDYANISPGARLGGTVELEEDVFLGINACVLPGLKVGKGATIGAGAVVLRDVPPLAVMVGVPASAIDRRR